MATLARRDITTYEVTGFNSINTLNIYGIDSTTYDTTLVGTVVTETTTGSFESGAFSADFNRGEGGDPDTISIAEGIYLLEIEETNEQYLVWSFEATQKAALDIIENLLCCKQKKDYYQEYTILLATTQVFEKITQLLNINIYEYQAGVTQVDVIELVYSVEARVKNYYANCFQKSSCC